MCMFVEYKSTFIQFSLAAFKERVTDYHKLQKSQLCYSSIYDTGGSLRPVRQDNYESRLRLILSVKFPCGTNCVVGLRDVVLK